MKLGCLLLSFFTFFLLTLSGCSFKQPSKNHTMQLPPGYFLSRHNGVVQLLQASEKKPLYQLNFNRKPEQLEDYQYIKLAEAIFPSRQTVRKAAHISLNNWYFERLWWHDEHQEYRIPYAITNDAVIYYIDKYQLFKEKYQEYNKEQVWQHGIGERVKFHYTATVNRNFTIPPQLATAVKNGAEPVKVTLHLIWYYYCGQPCGWGFEQKREVYFLSPRRVIAITGDGTARKWVSSPKEPFAPDQWITF